MLLREESEEVVLCIGQTSHSWLAGQLARAWGNERVGSFARREEVCLAAEQHDVGWAEWDLAPSLNEETGRPHAFFELPRAETVAIWREAPGRLEAQSRYASLLCSLHGTLLVERFADLDEMEPAERRLVEDYMAGERRRQERLSAEVGADPTELARARELIASWDALSLALCHGHERTVTGVPAVSEVFVDLTLAGSGSGSEWTLEPWPFGASHVTVRCEGRQLVERFDNEQGLYAALGEAPVVTLRFDLSPG